MNSMQDSLAAPSPAAPGVEMTPYTRPASVPREFGTYPTQGKSDLGEAESKGIDSNPPDMSRLSLNDSRTAPGGNSEQQPSATDKASEVSEGAKDAMYGGATATAGALGYVEG